MDSFLDQFLFLSIISTIFTVFFFIPQYLDANTVKLLTSLNESKSG